MHVLRSTTAMRFTFNQPLLTALACRAPCTAYHLHAGRTGAYIGSPELGPVNYFQTGEIRRPNAPLARDPWACRRLMDASLLILREVDPALADNKWAAISPDGQVGHWWLVCAACGGGGGGAGEGADPSHTRLSLELPNTRVSAQPT